MQRNDGTKIQNKLFAVLKAYAQEHPAFVYRFYDTKSAGNYLPAQPGDFFFLVPGHCLLLECKSSTTQQGAVQMAHHGRTGKLQIAKHRLWHRAGHGSFYIYHDMVTDQVEWHQGPKIIHRLNAPLVTCDFRDLSRGLSHVVELVYALKGFDPNRDDEA